MPDAKYFGVPNTNPSTDSSGLFQNFPQPFEENKNKYTPTQTSTKSYVKLEQSLLVNEIKIEPATNNEDAKKRGN